MTKFKIGEAVQKSKGGTGLVRAIFMTVDGEQRYAVENDGALDFVEEEKLSAVPRDDVAA